MKKVVNGKVYDTEMADAVTSWKEESNVAGVKVKASVTLMRNIVLKEGVTPDDAITVNAWGGISVDRAKIDRTSGELFLAIETGSWSEESRRIVPVTDDQAKRIVEKRGSFEDYVRWFGDPRGISVSPDVVKKAVEKQRLSDYEEKSQVVKERDAANVRVAELEARILELENR